MKISGRWHTIATALFLALPIGGCGLAVPTIEEVWEPVEINPSMENRIKEHIFCKTVEALRYTNTNMTIKISDGKGRVQYRQPIPDDYGVQMQLNLTIDEVGGFNPSTGYLNTLQNDVVGKVTVPQSFAFNIGSTLSSAATRVDTTYSYYNVGKITANGANSWCDDEEKHLQGSSPLLQSDLGIQRYLMQVVPSQNIPPSSAPAKGGVGKSAKIDVYSYEVKFIVVTNANINPVWKLVNLNAGTGALPLANIGRTRTHDLILTFGPGTNAPTDFALQTHFTGQIVQSNMRQGQGF
jgi:hypothetical protein